MDTKVSSVQFDSILQHNTFVESVGGKVPKTIIVDGQNRWVFDDLEQYASFSIVTSADDIRNNIIRPLFDGDKLTATWQDGYIDYLRNAIQNDKNFKAKHIVLVHSNTRDICNVSMDCFGARFVCAGHVDCCTTTN